MTIPLVSLTSMAVALLAGAERERWRTLSGCSEAGRKGLIFLVGSWAQWEGTEAIDVVVSTLSRIRKASPENEATRILSKALWLTGFTVCFFKLDHPNCAESLFALQTAAFFALHMVQGFDRLAGAQTD